MNLSGYKAIAMLVLILFFESGIFSLIFALSLHGLGQYTKTGAVLLTAATSGGAVVPAIMSPVTSKFGVQYGFCVVVAVFAFGALMPIYLSLSPAAKKQVDPVPRPVTEGKRKPKASNRASRVLSAVVRRGRKSSEEGTGGEEPTIKHVEGRAGREC